MLVDDRRIVFSHHIYVDCVCAYAFLQDRCRRESRAKEGRGKPIPEKPALIRAALMNGSGSLSSRDAQLREEDNVEEGRLGKGLCARLISATPGEK